MHAQKDVEYAQRATFMNMHDPETCKLHKRWASVGKQNGMTAIILLLS